MKSIIPFILLLFILLACQKERTIGIQPLGDFDAALTDTIAKTIEDVYGFNVIVMEDKPIPQSTFVNIKTPRYRADSLIRILKEEKPDSISHILGLIEKDISTTKKDKNGAIKEPVDKYTDWGIFGLGYRPGVSCIVSSYRITAENESLFIERLQKIVMHELGHNLGLKHCTHNETCVMRDAAETIKTVDNVELKLCERCLNIIN
ncbi:MAG: hypothetical protein ACPG4Z_03080 [Chitinophagales bacterium]